MGQTTKLFSQYAAMRKDAELTVIESDPEWVNFFGGNVEKDNLEMVLLEYDFVEMKKRNCVESSQVRVYKGFKEKLAGRRFDIISIDAPYGGDMNEWSRVDILSILPSCLAKSWIILVDDLSREGEKNTFDKILEVLDENEIRYSYAIHKGSNSFGIVTSVDNRFFCRV